MWGWAGSSFFFHAFYFFKIWSKYYNENIYELISMWLLLKITIDKEIRKFQVVGHSKMLNDLENSNSKLLT